MNRVLKSLVKYLVISASVYAYAEDARDYLLGYFSKSKFKIENADRTPLAYQPLSSNEAKTLKEIAADGVVTDEEVLQYGVTTGLVKIKKECSRNLSTHDIVSGGNLTAFEDHNTALEYGVDFKTEEPLLFDDVVERLEKENKKYFLCNSLLNKKFADTKYGINIAILKNRKEYFIQSQKSMGLKNVRLFLTDRESSYTIPPLELLDMHRDVYLNLRDILISENVCNNSIDHELGHIRDMINRKDDYKHQYERENNADSISAEHNPHNLKGAFELFLDSGEFTKNQFLEKIENGKLSAKDDPHAPNTDRVKRMLLITARKYAL